MFFKNKKKVIKCGECPMFNNVKKNCRVNIIIEGNKFNVPCEKEDECFFLSEENQDLGLIDEIQQVRMWVENPETGEPAEKGTVKIEYPEGFFQ